LGLVVGAVLPVVSVPLAPLVMAIGKPRLRPTKISGTKVC